MRRWLKRTALVAGGLTAVATVVPVVDGWEAYGAAAMGERLERMKRSPQWGDGVFLNPQPISYDTATMVASMADRSAYTRPAEPVPVVAVDASRFEQTPASGLRVTWLGHSTLLIEIDGVRILTDPVWGERSSPVDWAGPERWYPPPLALEDLPELDAIVISHDHYDHLDHPTILALRDRSTRFITPLGVGAHLEYWGVPSERIFELDWWETTRLGELEVVCTPARHFSGRQPLARDTTLWAGYAFVGSEHRAYFSGDTGLFPGMSEIGERHGPFDVTMIEAGAYDRAWPDVHLGPEQAVRAHQIVQGEVMLPIHWGLFDLANHGWTEPVERTVVAAQAANVRLATPRPGGAIEPETIGSVDVWWPDVPRQTAEQHPVVSTQVDPQ